MINIFSRMGSRPFSARLLSKLSKLCLKFFMRKLWQKRLRQNWFFLAGQIERRRTAQSGNTKTSCFIETRPAKMKSIWFFRAFKMPLVSFFENRNVEMRWPGGPQTTKHDQLRHTSATYHPEARFHAASAWNPPGQQPTKVTNGYLHTTRQYPFTQNPMCPAMGHLIRSSRVDI